MKTPISKAMAKPIIAIVILGMAGTWGYDKYATHGAIVERGKVIEQQSATVKSATPTGVKVSADDTAGTVSLASAQGYQVIADPAKGVITEVVPGKDPVTHAPNNAHQSKFMQESIAYLAAGKETVVMGDGKEHHKFRGVVQPDALVDLQVADIMAKNAQAGEPAPASKLTTMR